MAFLRLLMALLLVGVVAQPALPVGRPLGFRTQINQLHSMRMPFTGALVITVNASGNITGRYQSDSMRPDPMYGRMIPVTGSVSGNRIRIDLGAGTSAISINGTIGDGGGITGSAMMRGGALRAGMMRGRMMSTGVLTFSAVPVHLHNPPTQT
jgi:hypothetical protein